MYLCNPPWFDIATNCFAVVGVMVVMTGLAALLLYALERFWRL